MSYLTCSSLKLPIMIKPICWWFDKFNMQKKIPLNPIECHSIPYPNCWWLKSIKIPWNCCWRNPIESQFPVYPTTSTWCFPKIGLPIVIGFSSINHPAIGCYWATSFIINHPTVPFSQVQTFPSHGWFIIAIGPPIIHKKSATFPVVCPIHFWEPPLMKTPIYIYIQLNICV